MTRATAVREQKGAFAAEITTAPIFPIWPCFTKPYHAIGFYFPFFLKIPLHLWITQPVFIWNFPKIPRSPECPISWFWDWWLFCSVLGGIKRRVFSWNVLQSLRGHLTSCKNHQNLDILFFLYSHTQLCLKVVVGRFRFSITPIFGKRIGIEKFPPNVNFLFQFLGREMTAASISRSISTGAVAAYKNRRR